ncbi:MAG TPA: fibronectin type III domain-containing protein, partial [Bacteroidales bacterium]|nr:fibronectin type III domain-containing protein [Bacteroidales bacterium]
MKWECPVKEWNISRKFKPDSVKIEGNKVDIYFPVSLSYHPFREESNSQLISSLKESLGRKFRDCNIDVYSNGFTSDRFIPNIFRKELPVDSSRILLKVSEKPAFITRTDRCHYASGLENDIIALWHSHGYYFDQSLDRWEWQRAKLFGTVEDLSVMGYVLPFLTPMLENAGATVFLPRERDIQTNEVIVDNDRSTIGSEFVLQIAKDEIKTGKGFLLTDTLFAGINPFKEGTSVRVKNTNALYIPDIPAKGEYAVYISYPCDKDNSTTVKYTVTHAGGKTSFVVNQTIGGETWIYLGTFLFNKGKNSSVSSVEVTAGDGEYMGLDAIRFGGGMGNVARRPAAGFIPNIWSIKEAGQTEGKASTDSTTYTWKISSKPRFMEGARYFLQYAGMPDSLVYSPNYNKNDYNDDYQSRSLWVNYLSGKQNDPSAKPEEKGLGLPVDMAFAFHSDAGVTPDSTIVGTLGIYSTAANNGLYPDSVSRMAGRDYADIVQTQIVNDVSSLYNVKWTRRDLWDKPYYEARKPNVPVMLLELLSHQNLADQRFGLDPRFRFTVSRAVYKGMLKYISYNNNKPYIVEPLPVSNMSMTVAGNKTIRLSWKPTVDPLEPTAVPDRYRVYRRIADGGFDNGVIVEDTAVVITLDQFNTIYSFKVTAINAGGESFSSEVLAAGFCETNDKPVLVVNAFDRISGPAWFDKGGMAGVAWWDDRGVAWHYDIVGVGDQYNFDRNSPWLDDDDPGW